MKGLIFLFSLLISLNCTISAQKEKVNVTFFGSSVCKGSGDPNFHGYAWQFFHNGAVDTTQYEYINASKGGDNTIKNERDNRVELFLLPTNPDIVVIGLSLGNEGIRRTKNANESEQIMEQFRSRILAMADHFSSLGMKPVIVNCYAHLLFDEHHYEATKEMNRIINTWDYPSVNALGAIDDLEGKWVEGYYRDPSHPNTLGHIEMSYTMVPTLFDALLKGKKTPTYDWNRSYTTLKNDKKVAKPLAIEIENTMHSFSLSFRFKESTNGSITGFVSNGQNATINVMDSTIQYKGISMGFPKHLKEWNHVVLSHTYANRKTMLFVNSELAGSMEEQLSPKQVYFGGTAQMIDLKDIALHRSALNESEAIDLFNKKFIQSSLEFYNPLTKSIEGKTLSNTAQSLTQASVDDDIQLQHIVIKF